jgi:UDP-N-acetylmuramoylalanine--D-glutamate ligase
MTKNISEPVGVLGVGVEGRATIAYLQAMGIREIVALDLNEVDGLPPGVRRVFGQEHNRHLKRFATIFRSPGIRPDHPSLVSAREAGTRVTSAVDHFLLQCEAKVIGITGTVGKGTAASLTAHLLRAAGFTTHLGGNIGRSPLEFLREVEANHRVVLEISSFQAMDVSSSPSIGVVLKTTSEHLDWHTSKDEYLEAKVNLFRFQSAEDVLVVNADSKGAMAVSSSSSARRLTYSTKIPVENGVSFEGGRCTLYRAGTASELPLARDDVRLVGDFNLENIAAALLAAEAAGALFKDICPAAAEFEGLPHRLELVVESSGVRYFNDSFATRPEAAIGALACFENSPLSLILGGSEKFADFSELARRVAHHPSVRSVELIGATAERLSQAIEQAGPPQFSVNVHPDLRSAAFAASLAVRGGGVVLLSPACASFGLFPNYKVRGEQFRAVSRELAEKSR